MKEEIALKEKLKLTEQELKTVVDKLQELETDIKELRETTAEIKAIKLFLTKNFPEFKDKYPEILRKLNL
jgi:hypothetical protein